MRSFIDWLDHALGRLTALAAWLALPVVAALFVQWPLRDVVRCCSREVNDAGQWLFALYVAVALTAATRAGTHLAATAGHAAGAPRRRVAMAGALLALAFALVTGVLAWPMAVDSVLRLETFGDTGNPGYFIIKAAVLLLAGLMAGQALVDLLRKPDPPAS
jgi:TRAP-type mannitol/chloroaromatic compound transport system permease small subunit